jgi:phosphate:Na+ symporter
MVGTGVLPLELALFIILGANIGTCLTALLASVGANENSKRIALIHFTFNVTGTALFAALIWIFKDPAVKMLVSMFPGDDPMSLQMRVSAFHVIFNVTTTCVLLPFTKYLVKYSQIIIKDKKVTEETLSLKYVDDRLLSTPPVALMQVKNEMDYMLSLVEENLLLSFDALKSGSLSSGERIKANEVVIDFTNRELTKFLIRFSVGSSQSDETIIGPYFHVLNDLERIGDHAENFYEIGEEMQSKKIEFSERAYNDIKVMHEVVAQMLEVAKDAFENLNKANLSKLTDLENKVDEMKKEFISSHFLRLAEGNCNLEVSPYYSSAIAGLERVADHLVNVGYSIINPVGSQKES